MPMAAPEESSEYGLGLFGKDPWWLIGGKVIVIFAFLMITTLLAIWFERRVIGRMQLRPGPNRVGPFGILQTLADGIKLMLKEDIVPRHVDKLVFTIAPILAAVPAMISFIIIPFGPEVSIFGHHTPLQGTDLPVAVLLVLAMSSMGVYGIVLAGWASMSPFSLLGALRSSAQVISYEIAMGLSFVAVFLFAGSLSTSDIVAAQDQYWFALLLAPSFIIYVITMVGETNRLPFDLPEGEGEIVGGFHTEYSSIKFAMFFLGEYINMATVSALATTLFLGGWRAPWPISLWDGANEGWVPILWFLIKMWLFIWFFVWLRASLPRVRYDQLMKLGWKVLMPVSLGWILFVATVRALRNEDYEFRSILIAGAAVFAALIVASWIWEVVSGKKDDGEPESEPLAGRYPVPPMDAPHYHGVSAKTPDTEVTRV